MDAHTAYNDLLDCRATRYELEELTFVLEFLIAPATANTVAKIAYGISDSMITNSAAQAMKADVPVYILPVDQKEGEILTKLPNGRDLKLRMRKEDVENVEKLRRIRGITVLSQIEDIEEVVKKQVLI
ncbi:MAG: hypothetical protein IMF19_11510 [Proteobacteria bacterium]|nr:hypothetical protein [Pseudomonadota bacterium]